MKIWASSAYKQGVVNFKQFRKSFLCMFVSIWIFFKLFVKFHNALWDSWFHGWVGLENILQNDNENNHNKFRAEQETRWAHGLEVKNYNDLCIVIG